MINFELWGPGQKSTLRDAENSFGDLAEASISTPLGRVAFLVDIYYAEAVMTLQSRSLV